MFVKRVKWWYNENGVTPNAYYAWQKKVFVLYGRAAENSVGNWCTQQLVALQNFRHRRSSYASSLKP